MFTKIVAVNILLSIFVLMLASEPVESSTIMCGDQSSSLLLHKLATLSYPAVVKATDCRCTIRTTANETTLAEAIATSNNNGTGINGTAAVSDQFKLHVHLHRSDDSTECESTQFLIESSTAKYVICPESLALGQEDSDVTILVEHPGEPVQITLKNQHSAFINAELNVTSSLGLDLSVVCVDLGSSLFANHEAADAEEDNVAGELKAAAVIIVIALMALSILVTQYVLGKMKRLKKEKKMRREALERSRRSRRSRTSGSRSGNVSTYTDQPTCSITVNDTSPAATDEQLNNASIESMSIVDVSATYRPPYWSKVSLTAARTDV